MHADKFVNKKVTQYPFMRLVKIPNRKDGIDNLPDSRYKEAFKRMFYRSHQEHDNYQYVYTLPQEQKNTVKKKVILPDISTYEKFLKLHDKKEQIRKREFFDSLNKQNNSEQVVENQKQKKSKRNKTVTNTNNVNKNKIFEDRILRKKFKRKKRMQKKKLMRKVQRIQLKWNLLDCNPNIFSIKYQKQINNRLQNFEYMDYSYKYEQEDLKKLLLKQLTINIYIYKNLCSIIFLILSIAINILFKIMFEKFNKMNIGDEEENQRILNPYEAISKEGTSEIKKNKSQIRFKGFELDIVDLITWVPAKKKQPEKLILKGISTHIPQGKMTAIIGPSGSGKTTFMNFLAGRQNESQMFRNFAHYYINGTEIQNVSKFKNIIGYVLQEDIIEGRMTARQNFRYYNSLRKNLGEHKKTKEEIEEQVEDMIDVLGLEDCADTLVGNNLIRGISGGQKKRVNIGIELIQNPNLLFLDEPTTGLDSTTAFQIMNTVQKLKQRNITIVSTIHAPSQKILNLFDKIIILCEGYLIFEGKPDDIKQRLQKLQFEPKKNQPPLEYFLEIIDKDDLRIQLLDEMHDDEDKMDAEKAKQFDEKLDKMYRERIDKFVQVQKEETEKKFQKYKQNNQMSEGGNRIKEIEKLASQKNQKLNLFLQFTKIYWNGLKVLALDFKGNIFRVVFILINSLILYLTFLNLGSIQDGAIVAYQTRGGFLAMIQINFLFIGLTNAASVFFPQKKIFLKDQQGKIYSKGVFIIALLSNIYPFYLIILFGVLVWFYYGTKLNKDEPIIFFWFWFVQTFFAFVTGTLYGLLAGILVNNQNETNVIIPILILPILIVSGFFAQIKQMTWPLRIVSYISIPRFGFQTLIINEFRNTEEYLTPEACDLPEQFREQCNPFSYYDFYEKSIWLNVILGAALMFIFIVVIFSLYYRKFRDKTARLKNNTQIIEKYAFINNEPMKIKQIIIKYIQFWCCLEVFLHLLDQLLGK